jgi:hypothetical protein
VPGAEWTSFTPNPTGFSSIALQTGGYTIDGKRATVRMRISGTSNLTTFTVTNLPVAANSAAEFVCYITNGGTAATTGVALLAAASSTLTLHPTAALGTWTGSGVKAAFLTITYETQ